jgi:hypothetical protein
MLKGNLALGITALALTIGFAPAAAPAAEGKVMKVLFFGNSYTFRNDLADVVKRLAEAGNPGLSFEPTQVTYGGRILEQHWEQFQSQNILKLPDLTKAEIEKVCAQLEQGEIDAKDLPGKEAQDVGRYRLAARNHQDWMETLGKDAPNWDYVVLQSWRDTSEGLQSPYALYARKFADLARKRGARVILYNTGPTYQNADPLEAPPDPGPALEESRFVAALGRELNALVVPIPLAIVTCQTARPDIALRYHNDGHPNQTCGYLTACMFYAALFDRNPAGLPVDRVTDPKIVDKANPDLGPDGDPRTVVFSEERRTFLQQTAWDATQAFRQLGALLPLEEQGQEAV